LETYKFANKIRIREESAPALGHELASKSNFVMRKSTKDFNQYKVREIINR
jgi:hypothetical protein